MTSNSNLDEHGWIIQIRKTLEYEIEEEEDTVIPVSIFVVPQTLTATNPFAYVPQQIALGPYHHWRPELYEMEKYKLAAAKRRQKQFHDLKFQNLVDHFTKLEPKIRAHYHKYLNLHGETLAWMMAVDISFMLEFLQVYAIKEIKVLKRVSSRMSHLLDASRTKSAHIAILRDMVMLENQIPLFLLQEMLEFQFSSLEHADEILYWMLMGLYKEISPFKAAMEKDSPHVLEETGACTHLLDFLYQMIVPKLEEEPHKNEANVDGIIIEATEGGDQEKSLVKSTSHLRRLSGVLWNWLWNSKLGPVSLLKRLIFSKPVQLMVKLPWKIISNLPGIKILKRPIEHLFSSGEEKKEESSSDSNNNDKPPRVEEISIPSVTDLSKAGVRFVPTNGGISTISFDKKTCTLHLPIISVDVNSEVLLRNLVAYESCNASGPLVFTRYVDLMNGIVDTEEDAKLLRERGVIFNRLKSDKEVADLCNGMSKSVKLTKVPFLDKVVGDVNKYYSGTWRVKAGNFMKVSVFGSWQILILLAGMAVLLLMTLQAFCSVYSCPRMFNLDDFQE